jgi:hypothetical protein
MNSMHVCKPDNVCRIPETPEILTVKFVKVPIGPLFMVKVLQLV